MNQFDETAGARAQQQARFDEARDALESALHEIKRVIVGQDAMLERLLVALLAGGHVLLLLGAGMSLAWFGRLV